MRVCAKKRFMCVCYAPPPPLRVCAHVSETETHMTEFRALHFLMQKRVREMRAHLHLFESDVYPETGYERPLAEMMHNALKKFVGHMCEPLESEDEEGAWEVIKLMPVTRVVELFGFYYAFLDAIAHRANECDTTILRTKSNVIITHLRHIGGKCESLTNGRDMRNALAMLERVIPQVDELNTIKIDTGQIYTSDSNLLVLAGHSIACDMAAMLMTLAGSEPVH